MGIGWGFGGAHGRDASGVGEVSVGVSGQSEVEIGMGEVQGATYGTVPTHKVIVPVRSRPAPVPSPHPAKF